MKINLLSAFIEVEKVKMWEKDEQKALSIIMFNRKKIQ